MDEFYYKEDDLPGPGIERVWLNVYSPSRRSPPASSKVTKRAIILFVGIAFAKCDRLRENAARVLVELRNDLLAASFCHPDNMLSVL